MWMRLKFEVQLTVDQDEPRPKCGMKYDEYIPYEPFLWHIYDS